MAEAVSPFHSADEFAFQQSSPHSLRERFSSPPAPPLDDHGVSLDNSDISLFEADLGITLETHESRICSDDRRISNQSSISSFPTSVLHHAPTNAPRTPSRPQIFQTIRHESPGNFEDIPVSSRRRGYAAGFRNPSSVRAMQMKDEIAQESDSVTLHKRSGSQYSARSPGSTHSAHTSPSKRFSRSSQSSPLKSGTKLKKEFPLVLLHCTLLPPTSGIMSPQCDDDLFGALLPEEYRKRWVALQERLAMAEVKARGILIPHPQEDYDLLEERLLESLELEKPRIRSNHFLPREKSGGDSGFESESQTEDEAESEFAHDFTCFDCGKSVGHSSDRKWEIKVYAANGMMRAGAWAAAWREMEKVDIEIGLYMPEDLRREVNARLEALKASEHHAEPEPQPVEGDHHHTRDREVYGSVRRASSIGDAPYPEHENGVRPRTSPTGQSANHSAHSQLDLNPATILQDRKNVLILFLGITLMYLITGFNNNPSPSAPRPSVSGRVTEVPTTTVTSTAVYTATTTIESEEASSSDSSTALHISTHLAELPSFISIPTSELAPNNGSADEAVQVMNE